MTNIESIVNALLENSVITEEEAIELVEMDELEDYKSFEDWKRNGFSVKKGEHKLASCIIWSRPVDEEDEDGNKTQSFKRRWANIFSREQVELTADRKARRELEKKNEPTEKKIKALKRANKVDKEWIESHPNDGENSFIEWQISQREKEIAELEKAETPKTKKNSKKQTSKKSETAKTETKNSKKQTSKKSENVKKTETKKSEKKTKKTTKKAESKKAQPKAEKKLEKATKVVKTEKKEKKATKKLATKEVKRSFNISKRTEGNREYIVITNYDKDGNVKATAELPSNIYSSLDEEKKANFRKIFNIA